MRKFALVFLVVTAGMLCFHTTSMAQGGGKRRLIQLSGIILTALAALVLSLMLNILTARDYLEKQLFMKNKDNATALALSMSQQQDKDAEMMELLLSALFDNGHYQSIVLKDPEGRVIVERHAEQGADIGALAWSVSLLPIRAEPGVAFIQEGWKQYGTITLASHSKFAYRDLWAGTLELSLLFLAGRLVAGLLGTFMLRLITRPLDAVVAQAHAITERARSASYHTLATWNRAEPHPLWLDARPRLNNRATVQRKSDENHIFCFYRRPLHTCHDSMPERFFRWTEREFTSFYYFFATD